MSPKGRTISLFVAGVAALIAAAAIAASAGHSAASVPLDDGALAVLIGTECSAGGGAGTDCTCDDVPCEYDEDVACDTDSTTCVESSPFHCHKIKQERVPRRCNDPLDDWTCSTVFDEQQHPGSEKGCMDYYEGTKETYQTCIFEGTEKCTLVEDGDCGTQKGFCNHTPNQ